MTEEDNKDELENIIEGLKELTKVDKPVDQTEVTSLKKGLYLKERINGTLDYCLQHWKVGLAGLLLAGAVTYKGCLEPTKAKLNVTEKENVEIKIQQNQLANQATHYAQLAGTYSNKADTLKKDLDKKTSDYTILEKGKKEAENKANNYWIQLQSLKNGNESATIKEKADLAYDPNIVYKAIRKIWLEDDGKNIKAMLLATSARQREEDEEEDPFNYDYSKGRIFITDPLARIIGPNNDDKDKLTSEDATQVAKGNKDLLAYIDLRENNGILYKITNRDIYPELIESIKQTREQEEVESYIKKIEKIKNKEKKTLDKEEIKNIILRYK